MALQLLGGHHAWLACGTRWSVRGEPKLLPRAALAHGFLVAAADVCCSPGQSPSIAARYSEHGDFRAEGWRSLLHAHPCKPYHAESLRNSLCGASFGVSFHGKLGSGLIFVQSFISMRLHTPKSCSEETCVNLRTRTARPQDPEPYTPMPTAVNHPEPKIPEPPNPKVPETLNPESPKPITLP